jgi:hypothetical protein
MALCRLDSISVSRALCQGYSSYFTASNFIKILLSKENRNFERKAVFFQKKHCLNPDWPGFTDFPDYFHKFDKIFKKFAFFAVKPHFVAKIYVYYGVNMRILRKSACGGADVQPCTCFFAFIFLTIGVHYEN